MIVTFPLDSILVLLGLKLMTLPRLPLIVVLLLSPSAGADQPDSGGGALRFEDGDLVAFVGGTGMVKQFESGHLESMLTLAAQGRKVRFRDFGWQSDTVYRRQRPMNFDSEASRLTDTGASVSLVSFGQMESLDGATELSAFIEHYEKLLDDLETRSKRIVLVGPHRFGSTPGRPHQPDLTKRNGDAMAYAGGIADLAGRRGYLHVDMSAWDPAGLTTDGIHLTPEGEAKWAGEVAAQLLGRPARAGADEPSNELRKAIQRKNTLWQLYRRPTNWAFLYGDRQHVPSSKDHREGEPRWFPREVDAILPMIEDAEAEIIEIREGRK